MNITHQSKSYTPENVLKRYVRRTSADGGYHFCEVGKDRRYDLRQGTIDACELPEAVRVAADENYKVSMHYVDWPF